MGSAWKILPITAHSLWSVLGGGGRESPVKHGGGGGGKARAGGASTGAGGARAGKDRARGSSTRALCTGFTLVLMKYINTCTYKIQEYMVYL